MLRGRWAREGPSGSRGLLLPNFLFLSSWLLIFVGGTPLGGGYQQALWNQVFPEMGLCKIVQSKVLRQNRLYKRVSSSARR